MKKIIYLTIAGLALLYSASVSAQGLYADCSKKKKERTNIEQRAERSSTTESRKKVTITEDENNHIIYLEGRKDPIIIPKRKKKNLETDVETETIEVTYRRETTRTKEPAQSSLEKKTETNYKQELLKQDLAIVDYIRKQRQAR
ncbi:hypothetical protein KY336_02990 [Candidatus Woesearchaeota archaeon]|nr:hypothetical protein [Candidatus Woesearchaeota archaeon]